MTAVVRPASQIASRDRLMLERLSAMKQVALHMGMHAPCVALRPSEQELSDRLAKYGPELVEACVAIMLDEGAWHVRRTAASMILEYFVPDWRDRASAELLGAVVQRDDIEVRAWRARVLDRDGHRCQSCGSTAGLHAHHIVQWVHAPLLRVVDENGITLCRPCHEEVHAKKAG